MKPQNLFEAIPAELPEELCDSLVESDRVRIERIVSRAHCTAPGVWYDQDRPEWVAVLRGRAQIAFADGAEPVFLEPGDWLLIPAHLRHRVASTDPEQDTVWLAVHFDR